VTTRSAAESSLRFASFFLVDQDIAVEESTGPADLAAVDFDVVPRPEACIDAQPAESRRRGIADFPCKVRQGCYSQRAAMKYQLPSELPLVQVDCAAAGNTPDDADVVRPAIVEIDLAAQVLVPADQGRRRETQEADRVRDLAGLACLDERRIESDVSATLAHAGVDDPEFAHLFHPYGNIELPAYFPQILFLGLERITRDITRRRIPVRTIAG
jgi:hypothetical protein